VVGNHRVRKKKKKGRPGLSYENKKRTDVENLKTEDGTA